MFTSINESQKNISPRPLRFPPPDVSRIIILIKEVSRELILYFGSIAEQHIISKEPGERSKKRGKRMKN